MNSTNPHLGELLEKSLLDRAFLVYEKDADKINIDDLEDTANKIVRTLSGLGLEDLDKATFYVSPLTPETLCLGGDTWTFKLPFGGSQMGHFTVEW